MHVPPVDAGIGLFAQFLFDKLMPGRAVRAIPDQSADAELRLFAQFLVNQLMSD